MDLLKSIEPKSDQLNFDDVAATPMTVTVKKVKLVSTEQPVEIHLVEHPGRPFKPSKSMRRVLVNAWGLDESAWVDRQMVLFGDPTVRFGGQEVGGIRISHLSHIDKPKSIPLTVARGRREHFVVQPLVDDGKADALAGVLRAAKTLDELQAAWSTVRSEGWSTDPALVQLKDERKAELTADEEPAADDDVAPDPDDPEYRAFLARQEADK